MEPLLWLLLSALISVDGCSWDSGDFQTYQGLRVVSTSGVSAGHTIPHSVLCSCRGFASLPSLPIGELTRRRWDSVEANVRRFNTYKLKKGEADDLETLGHTELIKSEDAGQKLSLSQR